MSVPVGEVVRKYWLWGWCVLCWFRGRGK